MYIHSYCGNNPHKTTAVDIAFGGGVHEINDPVVYIATFGILSGNFWYIACTIANIMVAYITLGKNGVLQPSMTVTYSVKADT